MTKKVIPSDGDPVAGENEDATENHWLRRPRFLAPAPRGVQWLHPPFSSTFPKALRTQARGKAALYARVSSTIPVICFRGIFHKTISTSGSRGSSETEREGGAKCGQIRNRVSVACVTWLRREWWFVCYTCDQMFNCYMYMPWYVCTTSSLWLSLVENFLCSTRVIKTLYFRIVSTRMQKRIVSILESKKVQRSSFAYYKERGREVWKMFLAVTLAFRILRFAINMSPIVLERFPQSGCSSSVLSVAERNNNFERKGALRERENTQLDLLIISGAFFSIRELIWGIIAHSQLRGTSTCVRIILLLFETSFARNFEELSSCGRGVTLKYRSNHQKEIFHVAPYV